MSGDWLCGWGVQPENFQQGVLHRLSKKVKRVKVGLLIDNGCSIPRKGGGRPKIQVYIL